MNTDILTAYRRVIQTQVPLQEALLEYHFKATGMLDILLASNLNEHSTVSLYNFLWALSDMMEQAQTLSEALLNALLKAETLSDPPQDGSGNITLH